MNMSIYAQRTHSLAHSLNRKLLPVYLIYSYMYMFIYSKCVSFSANFCHDFPFIATNYIDESRERKPERRETKFSMLVRIKVHNITISTRLSPCPFQCSASFDVLKKNRIETKWNVWLIFFHFCANETCFTYLFSSFLRCTRVLCVVYTHSHTFLFGYISGPFRFSSLLL